MDTPDREMNPAGLECLPPREHVLVNTVDERTIEVEQESCSAG
jgi:hypothetical protein